MFADMIIVFGLVNNNLERHPQCNFDEYIEEGFVEGDFLEGYLDGECVGSTDIFLGPDGGRGGLTGRWLRNY